MYTYTSCTCIPPSHRQVVKLRRCIYTLTPTRKPTLQNVPTIKQIDK